MSRVVEERDVGGPQAVDQRGYGFVPLVLPVFGLLWLRYWAGRARTRRTIAASAGDAGEAAGGADRDPDPHGNGFRPVRSARDAE